MFAGWVNLRRANFRQEWVDSRSVGTNLVTMLAGLMAKHWCLVLRRVLGVVVGYPLVGAWERLNAHDRGPLSMANRASALAISNPGRQTQPEVSQLEDHEGRQPGWRER